MKKILRFLWHFKILLSGGGVCREWYFFKQDVQEAC